MGTLLMPEGLSEEELEDLTEERIEGEKLSRDFRAFVRAAWPYVESRPLIETWHIDAVCDHLEAVSYGEIENLIINQPPETAKSLTASVLWPAWEWGWAPETRWFYETYDLALALRDAKKTRELILREWYQARWPLAFKGDTNAMGKYENTAGGWRFSTMVGGHGTGEHMHRRVTDDPTNREKAGSPGELQKAIDWNDQTMSTRGRSLKCTHVVVMQRLAINDLSGHLLGMAKERGYVHLCLPMRYDPKRIMETPLGWKDPRKEDKELLCPKLLDRRAVEKTEKMLGPVGTAGQLQQQPVAAGGNVIDHHWLRFWVPSGLDAKRYGPALYAGKEHHVVELPPRFDQTIQSWDTSNKDALQQMKKGKLPDPMAGGVFGRLGTGIYLLDGYNKVVNAKAAAAAIVAMSKLWPQAKPRLIEDKANGPAIMAYLRDQGVSTIPIDPKGSKRNRVIRERADNPRDKDARNLAMAAMVEAGDYFLPHPAMPGYGWVKEYIDILCAFPAVPHDDWVDMTSQAFIWFSRFISRELAASKDDEHEGEEPPKTLSEAVARERHKKIEAEEEEMLSEYEQEGREDNPLAAWQR